MSPAQHFGLVGTCLWNKATGGPGGVERQALVGVITDAVRDFLMIGTYSDNGQLLMNPSLLERDGADLEEGNQVPTATTG